MNELKSCGVLVWGFLKLDLFDPINSGIHLIRSIWYGDTDIK
jgi:hypothetical protein